jgi:hypothetical protein
VGHSSHDRIRASRTTTTDFNIRVLEILLQVSGTAIQLPYRNGFLNLVHEVVHCPSLTFWTGARDNIHRYIRSH